MLWETMTQGTASQALDPFFEAAAAAAVAPAVSPITRLAAAVVAGAATAAAGRCSLCPSTSSTCCARSRALVQGASFCLVPRPGA